MNAIVIVIPAANEAGRIGSCLDAVLDARRRLQLHHSQVEVDIVVVLDNCDDDTESVVDRYPGVATVVVAARSVGAARRAGAAYGLSRTSQSLNRTWIANTDADSGVPVEWLTALCDYAAAGHHVVLGTVVPAAGLPAELEREWYRRHRLHDGHPHVHGANLSLRADVYGAAGGWPSLRTGEDVELVTRLAATPTVSIVRTASIPVTTSVRDDGRAPGGFSAYLRALAVERAEEILRAAPVVPEPLAVMIDQKPMMPSS